jgi:hypothetical protein
MQLTWATVRGVIRQEGEDDSVFLFLHSLRVTALCWIPYRVIEMPANSTKLLHLSPHLWGNPGENLRRRAQPSGEGQS